MALRLSGPDLRIGIATAALREIFKNQKQFL